MHIKHPQSNTLPLPNLADPPGPVYLNRKDPSAPPPPDPEIIAARNAERELIAQIKTPVKQPDGTWKARSWDWVNKCEKKNEHGQTLWKEVADPSLIAPDTLGGAEEAKKKKQSKKRINKKGRGGRSMGGFGSSSGVGKTDVKMREQGLMYRKNEERNDLPSDTSDEQGSDVDMDGEEGRKTIKGKTYRKQAALANFRNREKLPLVLEGDFGTNQEPNVPRADDSDEVTPLTAEGSSSDRKPIRYVSNGVSDVNDHYVAILFKNAHVGMRWVGREYTFGNRALERRWEQDEGHRGNRRFGRPDPSRPTPLTGGSSSNVPGRPQSQQATGDVDMELYRPSTGDTGDIKPKLESGPNPDAFPRMLASDHANETKPRIKSEAGSDLGRGRGRDTSTKPINSTRSLASKLAKFEQADYSYAKAGTGKDVDQDDLERGRARMRGGPAPRRWDDDDLEMRGRRGLAGRDVSHTKRVDRSCSH